MTLKYKILSDEELIIILIREDISLESFTAGAHEIWSNPKYNKTFNVLCDIRNARWKTNPYELAGLIKLLKNSPESATGKMGVLLSNPILTAMAGVFANRMMAHQNVAVFSTEKAVYNYLGTSAALMESHQHGFNVLIK